MTHDESTCSICKDKNISNEGLEFSEKEILPFLKSLMHLRPNHPFPMRFGNLFRVIFAYGQALTYNRTHGIVESKFYTENKYLLKFSKELAEKFGLATDHPSNLPQNVNVSEACEFNVKVDN